MAVTTRAVMAPNRTRKKMKPFLSVRFRFMRAFRGCRRGRGGHVRVHYRNAVLHACYVLAGEVHAPAPWRMRAVRRRSISRVKSRASESRISRVATARMVG